MQRVMLTIPPDLLRVVDSQAQQRKQNRSQFIRNVLQEWLETQRQKEFEALLAEGYQVMAEKSAEIATDSLPVQVSATEGVWHWDE